MIEVDLEIRRIEGIIPVEAVSRDLPLKLENFSYRDMKKLLSLISKGEGKGDLNSEFENLLKATFLEHLSGNRAKLKIGDLILNARIETDRTFKPGEEILLRVKGINESLELSIVSPVSLKLSEIVRNNLKSLVEGRIHLGELSKEEISAVVQFITENFPELLPPFKEVLREGNLSYSPYFLLANLLLLKEEVRSKLKNPPPKEEVLDRLNAYLSLCAFYYVFGILMTPFSLEDDFEGKVYYLKGDVPKAFIDVETSRGRFRALVGLIGRKVSVEYWMEGELSDVFDEEELRKVISKSGFEPILVKRALKLEFNELLSDWLKGKGTGIDIVT
ncbi:MAG: hypothetical protein DSZ25_01540 [Thermovibrio sp.]|nr:MAG: hypothetical protein DSZ25_01540 [Thermovibrio sp.]